MTGRNRPCPACHADDWSPPITRRRSVHTTCMRCNAVLVVAHDGGIAVYRTRQDGTVDVLPTGD